jgi:predicted RNase H-like nuclease (RuvC/YqgF family)
MPFIPLSTESILQVVTQIVTGSLLTDDQVRSISKNVVGSLLADWLPSVEDDTKIEKRVEEARLHITEANRIIFGLQSELDNQVKQLNHLVTEIEDKKKVAEHYTTLIETNKREFDAFKIEMEKAVRQELRAEAERGKYIRQLISLIIWVTTLILGAALGVYFVPIVDFFRAWIGW